MFGLEGEEALVPWRWISGEEGSGESSQARKRRKRPLRSGGESKEASVTNKPGVEKDVAAMNSEWVKRRREQVAKASRLSRERRKREVEGLREENQQLRDERDLLLLKIQELQEKALTLREQGSPDDQVENELLKAELERYEKFVSGFMKLAGGVPSSQEARRELFKQGADYAVSHTLSLASQSLKDDWSSATIPRTLRDALGGMCSACFQMVKDKGSDKKRLNLRLDMMLPGVDVETAAELYWNVWTRETEQATVYGMSHKDAFEFKPLYLDNLESDDEGSSAMCREEDETRSPSTCSPTADAAASSGCCNCTKKCNGPELPGGLLSAAYYREYNKRPVKDKDWVFVGTKRVRRMARSTIVRPAAMSVYGADSGDAGSSASASSGDVEGIGKPFGPVACYVLARSTTQHIKAPNHENSQSISSLVVEGCLIWAEKDPKADRSFTHLVVLFSMPDDFRFRVLNGFHSVVTNHGALTEQFGTYCASFVQQVYSSLI